MTQSTVENTPLEFNGLLRTHLMTTITANTVLGVNMCVLVIYDIDDMHRACIPTGTAGDAFLSLHSGF